MRRNVGRPQEEENEIYIHRWVLEALQKAGLDEQDLRLTVAEEKSEVLSQITKKFFIEEPRSAWWEYLRFHYPRLKFVFANTGRINQFGLFLPMIFDGIALDQRVWFAKLYGAYFPQVLIYEGNLEITQKVASEIGDEYAIIADDYNWLMYWSEELHVEIVGEAMIEKVIDVILKHPEQFQYAHWIDDTGSCPLIGEWA